MALSTTDPKVLFQLARCFSCPEPKRNIILQTYLLAQLAGFSTTNAGVQNLASLAACFDCLTIYQMIRLKAYLYATILGLPTTIAGVESIVANAACWKCLTPIQRRQLETYLLAVSAGDATTQAGVDSIVAAAKCFPCLDTKQLWQVQVYILQQMAPGLDTATVATLMQAAACFEACLPGEVVSTVSGSLSSSVAGRSLPPCVTPSAPINPTAKVVTNTTIFVTWNQVANSGSLITGYTVKWGTVTGVYTNSAVVAAIPKNYTITGLTAGTQYFFVVQANSAAAVGCASVNSSEGSATTTGGVVTNGLLNGLISYWKFDVNVSPYADSVGGNPLTGNTTSAGVVAGIINGALDIGAGSSFAEHASNADFLMGLGVSFAFSGWIFSSNFNPGANNCFFQNEFAGGAANFWLTATNGGIIQWTVTDTGGNVIQIPNCGTPTNSVYSHIVVGFDATTSQIYCFFNNGPRQNVSTITNGVQAAATAFRIGEPVTGGFPALPSMRMDEVAFWKNKVLTATDVANLFNGGAALPLSSFQA